MGSDVAQLEESSYHRHSIKVHRAMCMELNTLIEKISKIFPDIEAARPGASGIKALCILQNAIEKARLLIDNCCESSRFYLISQLIVDIRSAVFMMDASEEQAGKVVQALLQKDESFLDQFGNSEICALQFAAFRLHLTSPKDFLIEKRSIKKMLDKVGDNDEPKKTALKYLLHLLMKHDKLVLKGQTQTPSIDDDGLFSSEPYQNKSSNGQSFYAKPCVGEKVEEAQPDMFCKPIPPEEFKCPISSRIMYDPAIIASGQTFERMFIQKWFDEGNDTCPTTGMKLANRSLTTNTTMKDLISKWCKEHGINIYEPKSQPFTCGSLDTSSNSISSCGNSLVGLHLQIDLSSISLGSIDTNYSYSTYNLNSKIYDEQSLSGEQTDNNVISNALEFKFFTSTRDMEQGLLSDISQFPWESKCMAVEDVQSYLNHYDHARVPLSLWNFVEPIVMFLKDAAVRQDVKAQKDGAWLLLTGLRASRSAVRCINEDLYALLTSFLGTEITEEVLAIFELSSIQGSSGSKLATSGALISILEFLDTQTQPLQETSIKILYNLSMSIDPQSHNFVPLLDCIPRLVSLLTGNSLSGLCLLILKNLCCVENARILAAETEGCISAIAGLLDVGSEQDRENMVSILLSLCSQNVQNCKLVMDTDNILAALMLMSVNGNEKEKANAKELLRILKEITCDDDDDDEEEASSPPFDDCVYKAASKEKREECNKRGSGNKNKAFGFFGSRFAGVRKVRR